MAIINKTGITNGGTIQAEHVTRAIDALSGGSTDTVVATGSFSGSFTGTVTGTITSASYAPNFANTDLTFTGDRVHDTNGNAFEITTDNGAYQQGFVFLNTTKSEIGRGVNYTSYGTTNIAHYQSGSRKIDLSNTETVFNETGLDVDFRVESDTNANMFTVDAGTNRVGIGKASPNSTLDVNGNTTISGSLITSGSRVRNYKTITITDSDIQTNPPQSIAANDDIILIIDNTTSLGTATDSTLDVTNFLNSTAGRCVEIIKVSDGTGLGLVITATSMVGNLLYLNNTSENNGNRVICDNLGDSVTLMSMGTANTGSIWGTGY